MGERQAGAIASNMLDRSFEAPAHSVLIEPSVCVFKPNLRD
jgi:hypothetical protein